MQRNRNRGMKKAIGCVLLLAVLSGSSFSCVPGAPQPGGDDLFSPISSAASSSFATESSMQEEKYPFTGEETEKAQQKAKAYYASRFPGMQVLSCRVDPDNWLIALYKNAYPSGTLLAFQVVTKEFGSHSPRSIVLAKEKQDWIVVGEGF